MTELQLESDPGLGFEPALTGRYWTACEETGRRFAVAATALKDKINQASVLVNENRKTNEATTEVNDLACVGPDKVVFDRAAGRDSSAARGG